MYQTKNLGLNITEIDKDSLQAFNFDTDLGDNFKAIDEKTLSHRNITNCLLEVPQDIKLEIVDGVVTLKEGSKIYVPNGPGVFEEKIIYTDISNKTIGNDDIFLAVSKEGGLIALDAKSFTVTERPETIQGVPLYYNITTNKIEYYDNSVWHTGASFPIAIVERTDNGFTGIKQIFNGFGYIGSTVFVLPGVKGLIPNGRNEDGTLKNIEFTTGLFSLTFPDTTTSFVLGINATGDGYGINNVAYYEQEVQPVLSGNWCWFKPSTNRMFMFYDSELTDITGIGNVCIFAKRTNGKIDNLNSKYPFHAVDYFDYSTKIAELEAKIQALQAAVEALQGS